MNKVLITGANSGFGYCMALEFARNNYEVFATSRDLKHEGVLELNEIASKEKLFIHWLKMDVTKQDEIDLALKEVSKNGGLDVLINNAGYGVLGAIETRNINDVIAQFETNVFGIARLIYAFLPLLKESDRATIINFSSIAGLIAAPTYGIYSSSKWAVEAFSEVLRYELSSSKVRVSLIEPGGFDTNFGKRSGQEKDNFNQIIEKKAGTLKNLFGKLRNPNRVAKLALRIAESSNPKLRNIIGFDAQIIRFFRKILPQVLWEYMAKKVMLRIKNA